MAPQTNETPDEKKNGSAPFAAPLEPTTTTTTMVITSGPPTVIELVAEGVERPIDDGPDTELVADPPAVASAVEATPSVPAAVVVAVVESEEDEMKRLDYSKMAARLYQGSAPVDLAFDYAKFTMVVLCAEEYQPVLSNFRGKLIHAGFNDTDQPTQQDILVAGSAAEVVFRELVSGGTVLVTCQAGRNRSGLVVGLVLGRKMGGDLALARVREARPGALSNLTYAELVRRSSMVQAPTSAPSLGAPSVSQHSGEIAAAAIASGPGIVERAIKTVFQRGKDKPRGTGKVIKPGMGRGYFGKARTDRTPKRTPARGGGR